MATSTPSPPVLSRPLVDQSGCLKVVPLEIADAGYMAPLLRPEDNLELELMGWTPNNALYTAANLNYGEAQPYSFAVFSALRKDDRRPIPIITFGCHPTSSHVWMLSRPLLRPEQVTLVRNTKPWVDRLLKISGRPFLQNKVAAFNVKTIQWLEASKAFDVDRETPYHLGGQRFYSFRTKPQETFH